MRVLGALGLLLLAGCPKADKPAAPSPEAVFWTWFSKEEGRLAEEARAKDPTGAMMTISGHLEAASPGVLAEIAVGQAPMHPHTLVITADGDRKLFPVVKKVVAAAPALTKWKVVAFRQRSDWGSSIEIDGFTGKAEDFYFRELRRTNGKVDVEVLVKGMTDTNEKAAQRVAYLMLDHLLGEYDVETKVAGIAVLSLPENPGDDVKPLAKLVGVIDAL